MKFLLLLFLFPVTLCAQKNEPLPKDLAGVWTGYMYNDTTQLSNDFELAISENNKKLSGYTYTIFLIDGKKNIGVKSVKIRTRKDLLLIEDEKLIDDNYDDRPAKGVRTFIELLYSQNDTAETLTGTWKTNITREYNSVTGNIFVVRKKQPELTAIIPKLRQLNLLDQLSFVPPAPLPSIKNDVAGSPPSAGENMSSAQQNIKVEPETKNAGIVKNEKQAIEAEKIIPDTTITNEEITIFMFPKNDILEKDSTMNVGGKDILAINQGDPGIKKDNPVAIAGKNETKKLSKDAPTGAAYNVELKAAGEEAAAKTVGSFARADAQKRDSLNLTKNKETAHLVPPVSNNFPQNDLQIGTERSVVKTDNFSTENKNQQNILVDKNSKVEAGILNPIAARDKKTEINPPTENMVKAKNGAVMESEKMRNNNLHGLDNKNNKVVLPDSSGKMQIQDMVFTNKPVPQKLAGKEEGIYVKEMAGAAKIFVHKLITEEMLRAREIETIRTVEIEMDTLIFSLFDNGVVDGDTVSVLLNGEVIMSKIGLLAKAYNDTIYLTPDMGDSIHIILYAENLGSIPPNTGLLVVREGSVDHEIRFSGDLKKNSAVILKRKKQINGK